MLQALAEHGALDAGLKVRWMVLPDIFIDQDTPAVMYAKAGLDARGIVAKAFEALGRDVSAELHKLGIASPHRISPEAPMSQKPPLRIILAQPRGFCAGVVRAIEIVDRALQKYGAPVYVRHEIVHNKHVVESLKAKGARFVETVSEIPDARGHHLQRAWRRQSVDDEAAGRGLPVLNATCPLVTKVHNQGKRYLAQGRTLILIGHAGHPGGRGHDGADFRGPVSSCRPRKTSRARHPCRPPVAYMTQTTLSVDDTPGLSLAQPAFQRYRRPRDQGYLLRHPEPPNGGARAEQGG